MKNTDPTRIEAGKLETPAFDCDEGGELSIGIGRIRLWCAGAGYVKLGRALALAMTASPDEVGSVVLAGTDLLLVLDQLVMMWVTERFRVVKGPRTKRLTDTIFGWGSLQLVHVTYRDRV